MSFVLCADVGGTNCTVGVIDLTDYSIKLKKQVKTSNISDFSSYLKEFLSSKIISVGVCAAGMLENNSISLTNNNLIIKLDELRELGLKNYLLINDAQALGYATFITNNLLCLNKGCSYGVTKSLIAIGTGVGKSIIFGENVIASEGGHSQAPLDAELLSYLQNLLGEKIITYEDVISGRGIKNLYSYVVNSATITTRSANEISTSDDADSKRTMDLWVQHYALCARNFCLDALSTAGVYLAGGVSIKNTDLLIKKFFNYFIEHPTHQQVLSNIPIHLLTNYSDSLVGVAYALKKQLGEST